MPAGRIPHFTRPLLTLFRDSATALPRGLSLLARQAKLAGPRVHDARIAALCLAHGIDVLYTADRDFSLFPDLKTRNPLL